MRAEVWAKCTVDAATASKIGGDTTIQAKCNPAIRARTRDVTKPVKWTSQAYLFHEASDTDVLSDVILGLLRRE